MKILIINGPNINMLGKREKEHYGETTYENLVEYFSYISQQIEVEIDHFQSNFEGEIVECLQNTSSYDGIIINPAGYSHTSVAILDALLVLNMPVVEVHISNIQKRDEFRQKSLTAKAANGIISGLGKEGYFYAASYIKSILESK